MIRKINNNYMGNVAGGDDYKKRTQPHISSWCDDRGIHHIVFMNSYGNPVTINGTISLNPQQIDNLQNCDADYIDNLPASPMDIPPDRRERYILGLPLQFTRGFDGVYRTQHQAKLVDTERGTVSYNDY